MWFLIFGWWEKIVLKEVEYKIKLKLKLYKVLSDIRKE